MKRNVICFACDDRFAYFAGVAIQSILEKDDFNRIYSVVVLCDNVSDENCGKLLEGGRKNNCEIELLDVEPYLARLKHRAVETNGYIGSFSYFSRIFIQEYLNDNVEKVLYLDCDTFALSPIGDIFSIELGDKAVAGVLETRLSVQLFSKLKTGQQCYINSGVMLIDLKRWKELHIQERATELALERVSSNEIGLRDQPLLNIAFSGHVKVIDPKYNLTSPFQMFPVDMASYVEQVDQPGYYSRDELIDAMKKPVILHFFRMAGARPWVRGCCNPYKHVWNGCAARTPWGLRKREKGESLAIDISRIVLYRISPKFFAVFNIAGRAWKNL